MTKNELWIKTKNFFNNAWAYIKKIYNFTDKTVKKFIYTDFYLILVCACVFIGWYTQNVAFGFTSAVVIACIALLFSDDVLPLTVNLFSAIMLLFSVDFDDYTHMWPLVLLFVPCLIVFMVKNGRHEFHFGKMFFPLMAVAYVMLIGGCGVTSRDEFVRALPDFAALGLGVPLIYSVFNHYLKRDENRDIPLYFGKTMMYIGITICIQVIITLAKWDVSISQWHTQTLDIGWATRNRIATYLIFTAGMTLYLSTRYRQGWVFLAIGLFQYACIIMTFSRGAIIFGVISGIIAFILTIIKAPNKKLHLLYIAVIILAALIAYLILRKDINAMISSLLDRGMGSSGRIELYQEAWELFKAHPILGVGKGYVGSNTKINGMGIYWFHNTVFQILACMGIVGAIAYAWYYFARFKILFKNIKNSFNLFVLAIWVGFEGYSLLNTGTFMAYPFMMLVIIMTLFMERAQKDASGYVTPYNCITPFGAKIAEAGGLIAYIKHNKSV